MAFSEDSTAFLLKQNQALGLFKEAILYISRYIYIKRYINKNSKQFCSINLSGKIADGTNNWINKRWAK